VRVVLDANVIVAALISPQGAPARLLRMAVAGEFDLVVSEHLLAEVERAVGYPKLRARLRSEDVRELIERLRATAIVAPDHGDPPVRAPDPDDDYLLALAARERSVLVTGDTHLLDLAGGLPISTPRAFLELLERRGV
jgi:putative PIN family toxin of toxin-antitoxin system